MRFYLALLVIYLSIIISANGSNSDSLFFESFNQRYQNPYKGIQIAQELIQDDPQKAYLALAYNYFFMSDYDSANLYINKAVNIDKSNELVQNLRLSYKGWVAQRLGRYYDAYQYFNTAKIFYEKNKNKYSNNPLFTQGYIINSLGKITLQYYYINDFNIINNDLNLLNNFCAKLKIDLPNNLKTHIQYLYVQNFIDNNLDSIKQNQVFADHLKTFMLHVDSSNYYQAGNLFEVYGLYCRQKDTIYINDIIESCNNDYYYFVMLHDIINKPETRQLDFFRQVVKYFYKHNDKYQIAGIFYHIARYYSHVITEKVESTGMIDDNILDSLNKYILLSKKTYESRDRLYFDRINKNQDIVAIKDSLNYFTSRLISFPWYIKTLKLKHISDGLSNMNMPYREGFNTKLFRLLEQEDKNNSSSFYSQMENELTKRIEAEQKQNKQTLWVSFLALLGIIIATIIYIRFRRRQIKAKHNLDIQYYNNIIKSQKVIELSKKRLEKWNQVLNEVLNVKERLLGINGEKKSIIDAFQPLNEQLCKYFDAEYCAIGIYSEETLIDIASHFMNELKADDKEKFKKLNQVPAKKTIIGKFLSSGDEYVEFNRNEISDIENSYLEEYKTYLESDIENIVLFGLYGQQINDGGEKIVGYISFINIRTRGIDFKEKVSQITQPIKILIESDEERKLYHNRVNDEKFINGLIGENLTIEDIISSANNYFVKEFNAGIISFRVPVINGPDEKPHENLKLVLRNIYVDPSIPNSQSIEDYYLSTKKTLSLSDLTYEDQMLQNFPNGILLDEIGQEKEFINKFKLSSIFKSKVNIVFPIRKTLSQSGTDNEIITYWRDFYGIFNLQLFEVNNFEDIKTRLKYLSYNISYIIDSFIHKKKYLQVIALQNEISKLDYNQLDTFYYQMADMISKVINAEICSIFIINKYNNRLELKATTAKKAFYKNQEISISDIEYKEDVYYDLNDTNSVTIKTYKERKTYMFYSVKKYKPSSRKFRELSPTRAIQNNENYSRLLVPLFDVNSKESSFGVINCLGAQISDENLIHSFWDFDRETVEFISALASRFIVNAQLSHEKDNFIKQVVHETISPITEMLHKQVEYYNRLSRNNKLPSGYESYHKSFVNNIMLQKQILNDLSDVSLNKPELLNINASVENTKKILLDVVQLLEETAHFEKNISIQTNISELPPLYIDRSKIQQVFINLLKNAINYSNKYTTIKIFYKFVKRSVPQYSNSTWHEIKFVNEGIGIPNNEKEDIFLLYRRGTNAHKTKPSGSGIGLYLVAQIMMAHGGFCEVVNAGFPTEVSIFLPNREATI